MTLYHSESMSYEPTQDFKDCYQFVKQHLLIQSDNGLVWQKATPRPPFAEHLSFHLGNQKFFVTIADVEDELELPPNSPKGTVYAAELFNGIPCCIWVKKINGNWTVFEKGWGLVALNGHKWPVNGNINPISLITDKKIPLNSYELHYAAVICLIEQYYERFEGAQFNVQYDPGLWPSFSMKRKEHKVNNESNNRRS